MARCSVTFHVAPSQRMQRSHVFIRLGALGVLASVGCSSAYWVLYLALPVVAAALVARDGSDGYLRSDAPEAIDVVRWFANAYAYLWLLTDALPTSKAQSPVVLTIEADGDPSPNSALSRLITSLPALLLLAALSLVAALLWIVGAVTILAIGRVPSAIAQFITMKLRYQFRLVAYHLSLVDEYPVLADSPPRPTDRHSPEEKT